MTALLLWLALAGPLWAAAGAAALPRRYRRCELDSAGLGTAGAMLGLATGPLGVAAAWLRTPRLTGGWARLAVGTVAVAEALLVFRALAPANPCVTDAGYVANQLQGGLVIGAVYATFAVGLALIFSVLRIVSFAHGQFVMGGGILAFLILRDVWHVNPIFVVPVVGVVGFAVGALVERTLLTPVTRNTVDRKDEYAILVTFGLGIFAQYALLGVLGNTSGVKSAPYTDGTFGLTATTVSAGPLLLNVGLVIAGATGLVLCLGLAGFLRYTWIGRSLRAVALHPLAASNAGINSARTFTLAFALGSALAAMAGAALVPVLNFPVPDFAGQAALRSYVIVVLGGLGSVPGAFLGGLFIGVVEAIGAGCYPDPSKGAIYQPAFSLVIFAAVLLLRPQGFFGSRA
jgi:branched-chain amino acid transport system permease protein